MGLGDSGRCLDLVHRRVWPAVGDVLSHGAMEQIDVLAHQPDGLPQIRQVEVTQVVPVELQRATFVIAQCEIGLQLVSHG